MVPEDVPPARAVLAGTVETAVNGLWDAAPLVGDRVTVVADGWDLVDPQVAYEMSDDPATLGVIAAVLYGLTMLFSFISGSVQPHPARSRRGRHSH